MIKMFTFYGILNYPTLPKIEEKVQKPLHWAGHEFSSGDNHISNGQGALSRLDGSSCFWHGHWASRVISSQEEIYTYLLYSMMKCTLLLIATVRLYSYIVLLY